jgi:signal transduction histidine kinase
VFAAVYLGVLLAGAYYDVVGLCAGGFNAGRLSLLAGALLLPVGLEVVEHRRFGLRSSRLMALALLAARIGLYEIVVAVDCSGFSKFLYLIVPFAAFFVNKRLSFALAAFYTGLFVARLWSYSLVWYLNQEYVSDLLIFIIGLVFSITTAGVVSGEAASRLQAEKLLADLEHSHEQLKAYAEGAARLAAVEERNRVARDIHDSLGHTLTAITIQLEKAMAFRQRDPVEADEAVGEARLAAREALHDVRQSVGALYASAEPFSLAAALTDLAKRTCTGSLDVELHVEGDEGGYSKLILMSLFRVAQEALTNIQRHAGAGRAIVRVTFGEQQAVMHIGDDGRGFDAGAQGDGQPAQDGHYGLRGMRERLELLGGTLHVESRPNHGTQLHIAIPRQPLAVSGERPAVTEAGL